MKRLRLKLFLWSVLLISVFLKNVETSSILRLGKAAKSTTKPQISTPSTTVTVNLPRITSAKPNSARNTPRPKSSSRRTTTISTTSSQPTVAAILKNRVSTSGSQKTQTVKPSTTTLSPLEVMNRLYQMHGMSSHGVSASHSSYYSQPTTTKKKEDHKSSSSMDDIYRLHALAIAQGGHSSSHGSKKPSDSPISTEKPSDNSDNTKQKLHSKHNSMEHIYQQHSSLPSSMHHIMAQHSQQSSSKKPEKTSSEESSGSSSSLSTIMQPLLKQLTPVGAGIGVVLAPLLLFSGFLQFFSNMSSFLNNFAQTILPVRRPSLGQGLQNQNQNQNQNSYFQNLGPAHLKRQPREWMTHPGNMEKIQELTELFLRAMKEAEMQ